MARDLLETRGRKIGAGALIGLLFGGVMAALAVIDGLPLGRTFQRFELVSLDARIHLFADPKAVTPDLLVVELDEDFIRTLEADGYSWPPPRLVWERLAGSLRALGARAIVFDVTFADARDAVKFRGEHPFEIACADGDEGCASIMQDTFAFALEAWASGRVVVAISSIDVVRDESDESWRKVFNDTDALRPYIEHRIVPFETDGRSPPQLLASLQRGRPHMKFPEPRILAGARAFGVADIQEAADLDGVHRRFLPVTAVGQRTFPDLGLAGYAVAISQTGETIAWNSPEPPGPRTRPRLAGARMRGDVLEIGDRRIPVAPDGSAFISWRGNWQTNEELRKRVVPASPLYLDYDALLLEGRSERLDPASFAGKTVFIGFTIQGEFADSIPTPFDFQPGVFRQASVYDTIASGDVRTRVGALADALLIVLVAVLAGIAVLGVPDTGWQKWGGAGIQIGVRLLPGILLVLAYAGLAVLLFGNGTIVNLVHAIFAGLLTTAVAAGVAFVFVGRAERRERERIHGLFLRSFPPDVANEALAREQRGEKIIGGQRYEITLYFSDIAGFTTLSEKLSPEDLVRILNEYLEKVTDLIEQKHAGQVDKYIGDAVMAFWGAPKPKPDGALRACLAAVDAMAVMDEYSRSLAAKGLPVLKTRIGINTGPAVAGFIGHPQHWSYTSLGDTVNLASRLEGANKAYGTTCMIGPETYEKAKDGILARELDLVKVKGKKIPVRVYELMGRAAEALPEKRELKRLYEEALAMYRARRFEEAKRAFEDLVARFDDSASRTLAESCRERIEDPPPPDWDGSNELHEK